ncbi:apolipoprotein N-acyltransferase [Candidatus Methylopumilus turicensis]|uniref:Apolipoprotein N-acyltransferase n=1 Tax=Candidatus Methylopumilus turicensis TaxID=1581680 RepID=A0A0B7IZ50_9PROT|nr:apolipoprotein N-acyltransferase [Candidatus Methylopumilus turicensis]CEN56389.1 Apolipoprotein N-acyltransferase [Candidatus Methylopumilus turicensis]
MQRINLPPQITSLLLGALCVFGFAPFYVFILPVISLAGLFYLWELTTSPKQAAKIGFAFGLGFFIAGIYWIYISLHDIGGMPFWMAGLATFLLCAFLALFPALVGYSAKLSVHPLASAAILWVLSEWVRSWIFTGFPWLAVGYSQVPFSPLAGYAPILGVFSVGFAVTVSASLLVLIAQNRHRRVAFAGILTIWMIGGAASLVNWTIPIGKPTKVALIQGNIAQEIKWDEAIAIQTVNQYLSMAKQAHAELVILPETALPLAINLAQKDMAQDQVLAPFKTIAMQDHKAILVGAVSQNKDAYFNTMLGISTLDAVQTYHKSHLVPFGEFIPFKSVFGWIYRDWLNMPLSDLSRGSHEQRPMQMAGQKIAVNICYEDVFGEEIIRQLPGATLLVNASNDAWYGRSSAAEQHLQFSQMRALETGRMVLRATNTGATAIISNKGNVLATVPQFTTVILNGTVQGYTGSTPYIRWGNWAIISLLFIALILLWGRKKK